MDYYKRKIDMKDINYTLELDFFESIHGCTKKINVSYYKICDICNGIGMINSTICPDCKMKILNQELNQKNQETNKEQETNKINQEFKISSELNNISNNEDLNFDENILQLNNINFKEQIDLKQDTKQDNNKNLIQELNQASEQKNTILNIDTEQKINKFCKKCHNTGYIFLSNCPICKNGLKQTEKEVEITIQPRCDETTRYIIKNFNKGINGGKNGNLIINFKIKNDTKFKIVNNFDIQFKLDVYMKDAILGKVVAIPTIYQKYYKLTIPKFTQQGTKITIKHLGLLKENNINESNPMNNYGNMIIKINILIPTNLNEKQLKLIKQL